MFLRSFPAGVAQTHCYVLAQERGEPALICDPGQDSAERVKKLVRENDLNPLGIILTHGHFDHIADCAPLSEEYDCEVFIHPLDRDQLRDPAAWLSDQFAAMIRAFPYREPESIQELTGSSFSLAGIDCAVEHVPGHTAGSVAFFFHAQASASGTYQGPACLSGDTVFAGSVGRTDLRGGDHEQLIASIQSHIFSYDENTLLLPGHGSTTTIGKEKKTNPYCGI